MADRTPAEVLSFPTDMSTFDDDERISFSKLDNKYIAVQGDGTEFEFDRTLKRWILLADSEADAQIAAAQAAYGGTNAGEDSYDMTGPGGNGYGNNGKGGGATQGKKRKQGQAYGREVSSLPPPPPNACMRSFCLSFCLSSCLFLSLFCCRSSWRTDVCFLFFSFLAWGGVSYNFPKIL